MAYCPNDAIIVTPGAQGLGHMAVRSPSRVRMPTIRARLRIQADVGGPCTISLWKAHPLEQRLKARVGPQRIP